MTAGERPWWATDEDDAGGPTDPLEAHRAARRGERPSDDPEAEPEAGPEAADPGSEPGSSRSRNGGPSDDGSWWVPAAEAVTRLARDLSASALAASDRGPGRDGHQDADRAGPTGPPRDESTGPHRVDTCGVCPICVGLRALGEARPDLVDHLTEAARQLTLAVRAVVAAAVPPDDAPSASGRAARRRDDGLRRIDLDD